MKPGEVDVLATMAREVRKARAAAKRALTSLSYLGNGNGNEELRQQQRGIINALDAQLKALRRKLSSRFNEGTDARRD